MDDGVPGTGIKAYFQPDRFRTDGLCELKD